MYKSVCILIKKHQKIRILLIHILIYLKKFSLDYGHQHHQLVKLEANFNCFYFYKLIDDDFPVQKKKKIKSLVNTFFFLFEKKNELNILLRLFFLKAFYIACLK